MKVIDLLNKIANGDEAPEKIKYLNDIFIMHDTGFYLDEYGDTLIQSISDNFKNLNDEIEIIEEDKPIEKLLDNSVNYNFSKTQNGMTKEDRRLLDSNFIELGNKINEIIDKLNKLEEGKK